MARNFAGGTDKFAFGGSFTTVNSITPLATIAARFRTSTAAATVQMIAHWSSASRNGWALLLNNPANKIVFTAYDSTTQRVVLTSTASVNDGNWHTVVATMSAVSGGANALYIDGVSAASGNSTANWQAFTGDFLCLGDSYDAFWASYTGDLADVAYWQGVNLTADQIEAYNKGFAPPTIQRSSLRVYAPLVRSTSCRLGNTTFNQSGTTVVDHPRVVGSSV